ncbi:HTR-like protein [Halobiforma lacisalsi AJ5]|uniref:HTR-like protein n=1 Tax=Natronobacterium lacisalsi AJ5 TaxID=358396 RepID=M0LU69_NATLA|nr:histidine kinase N-terminal 7TM domain-containing protein [Halobiforma lacisalsi]APW97523.1 HTR-like protein [Halobiforma lacisalsi AJ5]EMA37097.1 HTR-like protein [Halobiforma lacisalsi AJ5]
MFGYAGTAIVLGSFAAGIASASLVAYLDRHRGSAGATWFMYTLAFQSLACFGYGIGLLVFDPVPRSYAEAVAWLGMTWMGPFFLAFALEYTGRSGVLDRQGFRLLFVFPVGTTALAFTHPYHDLLWQGFRIEPVFGLSTVTYGIQPWGYAAMFVSLVAAGVGVLLLVETILAYGPLYRREAIAVALSTVPPSVTLLAWLGGIGYWPALNLAPASLLVHAALDGYAFVGTDMFESNPTTRRAAERAAIDDLPNPVLILDPNDRLVAFNDAAAELIDAAASSVVGTELTDHFAIPLDDAPSDRQVRTARTTGADRTRRFSISVSPLTDPAGTVVGETIVLQDITERLEQEQQLSVLNRILRHNLRNEMTVIMGAADVLGSSVDDPELERWVDDVRKSGQALVDIGERAREFDVLRDRDPSFESVDVAPFLESVADAAREEQPGARIDLEAADATVSTDPVILRIVLVNLVANAVQHTETEPPTGRIRGRGTGIETKTETDTETGTETETGTGTAATDGARPGEAYTIEIEDDGPGIPPAELEAIDLDGEDPLEHGSGLGLWIVTWGVDRIGGTIEFDSTDEGTTVSVRVPTDGGTRGVDSSRLPAPNR